MGGRRLGLGYRRWVRRMLAVAFPSAGLLLLIGATAFVVRSVTGPLTVPEQYREVVRSAAASCPGLSPVLLASQIQQESNWRPQATSPAGALGIAQFVPATWSAYGVDGDHDGVKDVNNPADAIPAAARYNCVNRASVAGLPGDPVRNMLAAYNAGPTAVHRYRGVPPFPETRRYVDEILARAQILTLGD